MTAPQSALALARAIRAKEVSPVEVAKAYLAACDRRNPALNALVWRRDEELLAEARQAEAAVMRGDALAPFHGVPIPIKDLTEVHGHPTTHGSVAAKDKIGRYDATSVTLLKKAGFLIMGRSNSPEFGTLPVTENTLYGATRNPWSLAHTAGGSSGGAAAAVAAGLAPIAHASDGGGSIRIPASCCGLVGLKATRGRVPKGPWASEIMHGISTDGCVSTTVEDSAAVLDALSFRDLTAWYGVPEPEVPFLTKVREKAPKLRIGVTTRGPMAFPVDPACDEAVQKTAKLLADLGHQVEEVRVQWPAPGEQLGKDFIAVWCTASAYMDFPDWSSVEPLNLGLREMAKRQSSFDYCQAVLRLQVYSRKLALMWGQSFDLLLTPTLAMEPPKIGWLYEGGETDPEKLLFRCTAMVPYTGWCNVTGQPAISLPTHVAPSGLPIGVQLVAAAFREDLLLQVARQLEEVLPWASSLPQ